MQPEIPIHQRHHRFFFPEEFITLEIDTVYFNLPTFIFKKHSRKLQKLIDQSNGALSDADLASLVPIEFSVVDLERFLGVIFPTQYGHYDANSFDEWASILKVATQWEFESIVKLALERIEPLSSAVDKVVLGKDYNMPEWAIEGRVQLCRREEPITMEEAIRMGMEEVVNISTTRHHIRPSELSPELQDSTIRSILSGEEQEREAAHNIGIQPQALQKSKSRDLFSEHYEKTISLALEFRKQRNTLQSRLAVLTVQKEGCPDGAGEVLIDEIEELELQIDALEERYVNLYSGSGEYSNSSNALSVGQFDNVGRCVRARLKTCLHPDSPIPHSFEIRFSSRCKKGKRDSKSQAMEQEALDVLKSHGLEYQIDEARIIVQLP
ncbi:hypothetical protein BDN72DRAFT_849993 [Pluteus cervinus]|uniref:Uncharacterized protein n=1 Tax=Pluteus cervinus TaxID=181527 RepID=A0ACD3A6X5_9AGAR|nr:hypothetical protein BDN72DRAFT_849993 [Pluteus cervinus]